jgi:hypothetical protein
MFKNKRETISVQVKCQMSAHKITVTNVKLTRNRLVVNVLQRSLLATGTVNQIFKRETVMLKRSLLAIR